MATTIETGVQNTLQNDLANTLLSKLDINSKFLNEVVDRALTIVSKNARIDTEKLKQNTKVAKEPAKTKDDKSQKEVKNANTIQQTSKPQPLNVTNNTFEIVNTPKQETKPLDTVTKSSAQQETILDRFLNTIEKTTSKLEETVKKVPRPWELTPGTSMGYQMLTGDDEAMTERIRKGLAQFIGRYVTNIKTPVGYDTLGFEMNERNLHQSLNNQFIPFFKSIVKTIIKDLGPTLSEYSIQEYAAERDILYREMFDLPPRTTTNELKKTKPKEYTLTKDITSPFRITEQFDKSAAAEQYILGGTYLTETPDKKNYQYKDVWDIVSSYEKDENFESLMKESPIRALLQSIQKLKEGETAQIRKLVAPLLRPATVSGTITKEGIPKIPSNMNLSEDLTKEVSTKLEKMPVFSSLTRGLNSLKSNKWVDGLKEISSIAPSVKPVISLLTAKDEPLKTETADTTNLSESFNKMKDSTLTKVTSWTNNLYSWSKDKVTDFTESLEDSFKEIKSSELSKFTKTKPLDILNSKSTSLLASETTSKIAPSLENTFNKDSIEINNDTLDKIASNTESTNTTIKTLGEAIFKLAQSLNSGSKQTTPVIINKNAQDTLQQPAPASYIAATNQDPIAAIRRQFLYSTG